MILTHCATFVLQVNSKVFYKETAQDAGVDEHASAHEPQFELYELSIADMSVTLIDLMYLGDDDEESERESVVEDIPSTAGRGMPFSVDKERVTSSETISSSGSLLARNDRLDSFSGSNPLHGVRTNPLLRPNSSSNNGDGTTTRNASLFPRIEDDNNDSNSNSNSNQDSNDISANNSSKKEEAIAIPSTASDVPPPSDVSTSSILSSPQREKKKRVGGGLRFAGGDDDATTSAATAEDTSTTDTAALPPPPPPGALNKEESSESVAVSSPGSASPDHSNPTTERKKKKKVGGIRFSEDTPVVISEDATNNDTSQSTNINSNSNNQSLGVGGGLLSRTTSSSTKVDEDSIEMQSISSSVQEGVVTVTTIAPAPLPPQSFNRGDLMKKSRSRSFFGGLTKQPSGRRKSIFQSISATLFGEGDEDTNGNNNNGVPHTESEDDILRDMARDSLNWKNESGDWRKRVLEEERALREKEGSNKLLPKNLTTTIKKKKKKFHLQKIDQVTVVFPLPSKDPLLSYRRLFDYADAFNFDKDAKIAGQDIENQL